jgi:hypothetical protein
MGIIDALKPIHQGIYFILWSLAQTLWDFDRILLTVALWINSFRNFVLTNAAQIVELVADGLASPAGMFLALAFVVYGLWRLAAIFFPNTTWKPVELPRVIVYGLLIGAFFAGPAVAIVALEDLRIDLAENVQNSVTGSLAPTFTPPGYSSSEPGLTVYDIDGSGNASGINLAASLMGVQNVSDLGSPEMPPAFQSTYFTYGTPADFTLDDEDARTEALTLAGEGVLVLFLAPLAILYAICESLLWLILTVAALILWVGLPIALMLAPFRISEGLFSTFFNRYASLWIETIISAAIMGIFTGVLANAAAQGMGLFLAAGVLATLVVLWRILSATKIASTAVGTVGGANVTGGVSLDKAAGTVAAGTTAVVGGLVTGGLTTAAVAAGGALIAGSNIGAGGSSAGSTDAGGGASGSKAAALGGFLLGKSGPARRALQTFQEARLISGAHSAEQPDAVDAAYVGSLLSNRGTSSAYLTLGMMGGPQNAYRNLGLAPQGNGNSWGVDEDGNNPADWDRPAGGRGPGGQYGGLGNGMRPRPGSPGDNGAAGGEGRRNNPDQSTGGSHQNPEVPEQGLSEGSGLNQAGSQTTDLQQALAEAAQQMSNLSDTLAVNQPTFTGQADGINQWIDLLSDPAAAGTTHEALISSAGRHAGPSAQQVAAAVGRHGASQVQEAVQVIANQVQTYEEAGISRNETLQKFQDGRAYQDLADGLAPDSPFRPGQAGFSDLPAIADMTLAARRHVNRQQLVAALGSAVEQNDKDAVEAASSLLGTPAGLGSYAGVSRLAVERARSMGVSGEQLTVADTRMRQGDAQGAFRIIRSAPQATDESSRQLMSDLDVLPAEGLDIAQTVQPQEDREKIRTTIQNSTQEERP